MTEILSFAHVIRTERLTLLACPAPLARALALGKRRAESLLGVRLAPQYPTETIRLYLPQYAHQLERDPAELGWGLWLLIHTQDRVLIGDAGFKGKPTPYHAMVDLGYGIAPFYRRCGYGFEAARALRDWAFAQPGVEAITADCLADNPASIRILEKLGMRRLSPSPTGLLMWQLSRSDYQQGAAR
jgi:ribosomal-protein-alanine N-acetyltransferase